MVDVNSYFAGEARFLRAADFPEPVSARIEQCEVEPVGDKEKLVLRFAGLPKDITDRGLVLNKVNGDILAAIFGPESDSWVGQSVVVFNDESVRGPGGIRGGIRIRRLTSEYRSRVDRQESDEAERASTNERAPF